MKSKESSSVDLATFYDCVERDDRELEKNDGNQLSPPVDEEESAISAVESETDEGVDLVTVVRRRLSVQAAAKQFKSNKMESKKEVKTSMTDKIVEAFVKSEMKKNYSFNDAGRVDSGTRRNGVGGGGVSPENGASESDLCTLKNPKKLTVFEGMLSDDLPPLNSKIVRIFTSSTFTGKY